MIDTIIIKNMPAYNSSGINDMQPKILEENIIQYLRGVIRGPTQCWRIDSSTSPFRGSAVSLLLLYHQLVIPTALALQALRKSPDLVFSLLNRGFSYLNLHTLGYGALENFVAF